MTPASLARHHTLAALVDHAQRIADAKRDAAPRANGDDREYLIAAAEAAQRVADGIRRMPGFRLEAQHDAG